MFREHVCHVQACSVNTLEQFPSVFSEKSANYEAFCQMRKKIQNLSIKITRQQKNLKTVSVHYKNTDLILKMIKKAKISRVRVPLTYLERETRIAANFHKLPMSHRRPILRKSTCLFMPLKRFSILQDGSGTVINMEKSGCISLKEYQPVDNTFGHCQFSQESPPCKGTVQQKLTRSRKLCQLHKTVDI